MQFLYTAVELLIMSVHTPRYLLGVPGMRLAGFVLM